ncbi:MAG: response regulator [Azospira oryzae]|nr:MAG: response regulator [Azospira oryzae]
MRDSITVLYVDDDEDDISLFRRALSRIDKSISFLSFTDGRDALTYLKQSAQLPDYLFLDINMPRMNGKQVLQSIKQDEQLAALPVIMYSTSRREQEVMEFYEEGAAGFIHKKNSFEEIQSDLFAFFIQ